MRLLLAMALLPGCIPAAEAADDPLPAKGIVVAPTVTVSDLGVDTNIFASPYHQERDMTANVTATVLTLTPIAGSLASGALSVQTLSAFTITRATGSWITDGSSRRRELRPIVSVLCRCDPRSRARCRAAADRKILDERRGRWPEVARSCASASSAAGYVPTRVQSNASLRRREPGACPKFSGAAVRADAG